MGINSMKKKFAQAILDARAQYPGISFLIYLTW